MKIEQHRRIREVVELTGLKEQTLRRMVRDREVGFRKVGRCILIPESEVQKLLGPVVR